MESRLFSSESFTSSAVTPGSSMRIFTESLSSSTSQAGYQDEVMAPPSSWGKGQVLKASSNALPRRRRLWNGSGRRVVVTNMVRSTRQGLLRAGPTWPARGALKRRRRANIRLAHSAKMTELPAAWQRSLSLGPLGHPSFRHEPGHQAVGKLHDFPDAGHGRNGADRGPHPGTHLVEHGRHKGAALSSLPLWERQQPVHGIQPDDDARGPEKIQPVEVQGTERECELPAPCRAPLDGHGEALGVEPIGGETRENRRDRGGDPGDQRVRGEVGGGLTPRRHLEGQGASSEVHPGDRE